MPEPFPHSLAACAETLRAVAAAIRANESPNSDAWERMVAYEEAAGYLDDEDCHLPNPRLP